MAMSDFPTCMANTANQDKYALTKPQWEQCLEPNDGSDTYLSIVIVTRMDDYAGYVMYRAHDITNLLTTWLNININHIESSLGPSRLYKKPASPFPKLYRQRVPLGRALATEDRASHRRVEPARG